MTPIINFVEYKKYGFVRAEFQQFNCPVCGKQLNAGPKYQPKQCKGCSQHIDFSQIEFVPEKILGYC